MSARLSYVRDVSQGHRRLYRTARYGQVFLPALFCKKHEPEPGAYGVYLPLHSRHKRVLLSPVLGLKPSGSKPQMFKAVQEQVYYLYHEKKRPLCLAIDECQYLSPAILNDLKLIMNHGYDSLNCFSLILCGESYFNRTLSKPVNEALRQRVVVHYDFVGLSDEEVAKYVSHKIQMAGGSLSILSEAALSAVHGYAQGNARMIDNLMTDALIIGEQTGKQVIDPETILAAVNNQQL